MRLADYVYHPPSGSSYPGKEEANPYVFYPPQELRKLVNSETNEEELLKIKSALKQWERIYVYPGYPYRLAGILRKIAGRLLRLAEVTHPSINLPYYQDAEVSEGIEGILESITGPYDNQNERRTDYSRQGERPLRDTDYNSGDFLTPSDSIWDQKVVQPRGDGTDPSDMETPFPPTGGDIEGL